MDWGHWELACDTPPELPFGFVYRVTNLHAVDGEPARYIGQKQCYNKIRRKPLKGKRRVRRDIRESDWRTYKGSCKRLLDEIEILGTLCFRFEILEWAESKWELSWRELQYQVECDVLRDPTYYNGIIQVRLGLPPKSKR